MMRSWTGSGVWGRGGRQRLVQVGLAVGLVVGLLWFLPVRRAGEDGGHHGAQAPTLDLFEKAGVVELKEGTGRRSCGCHGSTAASARSPTCATSWWS
jgi:hypothetical protein